MDDFVQIFVISRSTEILIESHFWLGIDVLRHRGRLFIYGFNYRLYRAQISALLSFVYKILVEFKKFRKVDVITSVLQ